jgi:hypothetical protein
MNNPRRERGVGLIVVIIVTAFLLVVGLTLATITGTGTTMAGNVRLQEQAFNAAEAGFNRAWTQIEEYFVAAGWTNFGGHCVDAPAGIDDPNDHQNHYSFRTDDELLALFSETTNGVIFYKEPCVAAQPGVPGQQLSYTVFLIEDDGGGMAVDPSDATLVCIGSIRTGKTLTTARLEIGLAMQSPGT